MNLTGHEIVLDAWQRPPAGAGECPMTPSVLRLGPAGLVARVDDGRAQVGEGWLSTAAGTARLTRLRRSGGSPACRDRSRGPGTWCPG